MKTLLKSTLLFTALLLLSCNNAKKDKATEQENPTTEANVSKSEKTGNAEKLSPEAENYRKVITENLIKIVNYPEALQSSDAKMDVDLLVPLNQIEEMRFNGNLTTANLRKDDNFVRSEKLKEASKILTPYLDQSADNPKNVENTHKELIATGNNVFTLESSRNGSNNKATIEFKTPGVGEVTVEQDGQKYKTTVTMDAVRKAFPVE